MESINQLIDQKIAYLRQLVKETEDHLNPDITGSFRISISGNKVRYYYKKSSSAHEKYVSLKNTDPIKKLAQKKYDEQLLRSAKTQLNNLQKFASKYDDEQLNHLYDQMIPERKKLVTPYELPWDEFVNQWFSKEYKPKGFSEEDPVIHTKKGERVRSKSERMIANFLYENNIPYKYESPLFLHPIGLIYPDFTILSRRTRQEIYWEHCGKMDDPGYSNDMVKRFDLYERNGYTLGKQLIATFETKKTIIQEYTLENILQTYFI